MRYGSTRKTSRVLHVYKRMIPKAAVVSAEHEKSSKQMDGFVLTKGLFPHPLTIIALEECGTPILTTDGSFESQKESPKRSSSLVVVVPPGVSRAGRS